VNKGAFVRKGQPVGQIGNSGDGTMPHLHLEVLSSPDRIAAQGVPFVLSSFGLAGRIDRARLLERGPTGSFTDSHFRVAQARSEQLPLDLTILDFESSSGSSGNPLL
jgi:murein DD-endopeptidase MepM/ murein hydrolase activator NlpD